MEQLGYRILCLVIGYICGLFQTGFLYGKYKHVDIREHGSGNAGTTNAMRVLGKKAGIITYIGDTLKAMVAGGIVRLLCAYAFDIDIKSMVFLLVLYTGFGVVLGHNYPFYMGFKGGKGIAASSGVIIALGDWKLILLGFFTFTIITIVSKYVSLGSICMMTGLFAEVLIFGAYKMLPTEGYYIEIAVLTFLISGLAIFRHRGNIVRLIHGEERKILQKKKAEE